MSKVTREHLEELVSEVRYFYWDTLTICVVEVENGYKVIGFSACADPTEYTREEGDDLAFNDALNKLWPLEGYLLREMMYQDELDQYIEGGCMGDPDAEDVFVEDDPIDSERNDVL